MTNGLFSVGSMISFKFEKKNPCPFSSQIAFRDSACISARSFKFESNFNSTKPSVYSILVIEGIMKKSSLVNLKVKLANSPLEN